MAAKKPSQSPRREGGQNFDFTNMVEQMLKAGAALSAATAAEKAEATSDLEQAQFEGAEYEDTKPQGVGVEMFNDKHNHANDVAIYTWTVASKRKTKAGSSPKYTILLFKDGCMSCDCPGWTFKKSGKSRACKHTEIYLSEGKEFVKLHKAGKSLPNPIASEEVTYISKEVGTGSGSNLPAHGRKVCLD